MNEAESRTEFIIFHLADRLSRRILPGWLDINAEFAVAGGSESFNITVNYPDKALRLQPSETEVELIRKQRSLVAEMDAGPWWRMLLQVTGSGEVDFTYDYGEVPFPEDQLFSPEAYRADLEKHPRRAIPLWMNAYINHGDRQRRSPRRAAMEARENRTYGRWPQLTTNEFPSFPEMWARWAVISAAFVAAGSEWGPRISPGFAWFESSRRGGATLYRLPGDRAVLSGGVWNAPSLESAYAAGRFPELFKGAPEWVADPVLNPRGQTGLMTFCYWWEGGRWYRGDSPSAAECATAMPGVWTKDTVAGIVDGLSGIQGSSEIGQAAEDLVSDGQQGTATREALIRVFPEADSQDVDSALFQLSIAGVHYSLAPDKIPKRLAVSRARKHLESQSEAEAHPSVEEFVTERLGAGWRVYVPASGGGAEPVEQGVFVDDDGDGVFVESSEAGNSAGVITALERRFRSRHSPGDVPPTNTGEHERS
ncbi:hypothetical protein ACUJ8N_34960 [Streptomyces sp. ESR1.13]|uniref:hypothetical protein n=1 Tax=unclassified Streptomyces TaxID=2593676 RepID=UPI00404330FD